MRRWQVTRHTFTDVAQIRKRAEDSMSDGYGHISRWWSKKYNLPPNHPLFAELSWAEHEHNMLTDFHTRKTEMEEMLNNPDADHEEIRDVIASLNRAILGTKGGDTVEYGDDLVDQWEADIAAGRTPDLDA
jgi:hypothetical protein